MRLYLARHGEAVPGHIDPDSPLTAAGKADVERVGRLMAEAMAIFKSVKHSGKTRARQTAEILAAIAGGKAAVERMDGITPMDPPEPVAARIETWTEDTLLVAHLPFVGRLFGLLAAGGDGAGSMAEFAPGSVACLQRMGGGRWSLRWMISPELFLRGQ